jgi:hypothetical protein
MIREQSGEKDMCAPPATSAVGCGSPPASGASMVRGGFPGAR